MAAPKFQFAKNRPVLDQLEAMYGETRIYEADLRMDALLGQSSEYNFSVLAPDNNIQAQVTPNENRLNKADSFVATHHAIMIWKVAATVPTQAQFASTILRTFPNPLVFTAGGQALALESLYVNGFIQLLVDDNKYQNQYSLQRFRRVPQSQEGVGSTAVSNAAVQRDQYDLESTPYVQLMRPIIFNGSSKIDLSVNLNTSINMAGTSSQNYISILYRGYLVSGANTIGVGTNKQ